MSTWTGPGRPSVASRRAALRSGISCSTEVGWKLPLVVDANIARMSGVWLMPVPSWMPYLPNSWVAA